MAAKNLTVGNPLKLIILFAIPQFLGNLFQQLYNVADASLVGHFLGANSLAAVGASGSVQFLVMGFCIGICAGFAIPIAQRFGAEDYSSMRNFIFVGGSIAAGFAIILTIVCTVFCKPILNLLSTPQEIFQEAYRYLFIIFLGIPFSMLYNLLAGYLRSVGDSKSPFYFLLISTFLNIFLDTIFIVVFNMGVIGAALATIISQAVSGILCLLFIIFKYPVLHIKKSECVLDGKKAGILLSMGIPMGLQFSITAIGTMVLQRANNGLGSLYVSAFTAGSKLKQFSMCPFDALATAVATFAGQNYGAGKLDRINKGIFWGTFIGVVYGIFIGLVLIFMGKTASLLFISKENVEVIETSAKYASRLGYFFWLLGFLNVFRMTIQGLGFSNRAIFSGVVEMFARCIVSFGFVPFLGFDAVSFADQAAWLTATLYCGPTLYFCIRKIKREKEI